MKKMFNYFNLLEIIIWSISTLFILLSFLIFQNRDYITLFASIIGVTSLIFNTKGNPIGQALMIIFSIIYGLISFKSHYYGETLTYVGMTLPMSILSLISWIKHPSNNKNEVKVNAISKKEIIIMFVLTLLITFLFYFILKYFHTNNIIPSTISVSTSFMAVYLTFKRSPLYALGYACNDIVLIILWSLSSINNSTHIALVFCFIAFLINDLYGFFNWQKIKKRQDSI